MVYSFQKRRKGVSPMSYYQQPYGQNPYGQNPYGQAPFGFPNDPKTYGYTDLLTHILLCR